MIQAENLSKAYGAVSAISAVSFSVPKGQFCGLLGGAESGKSSLLHMLSGFIPFDQGSIKIMGIDLKKHHIEARRHIGFLPQTQRFYQDLTILEYFKFIIQLRGIHGRALQTETDRLLSLLPARDHLHQMLFQLPLGVQKQVFFIGSFAGNPEILLLDEPTANLDPLQAAKIRGLYPLLSGHTVLFSTQSFWEASHFCRRALILNDGALVFDGKLADLTPKGSDITRIKIRLQGTQQQARAIFSAIPQLLDLEAQPSAEDGALDFVLEGPANFNLRQAIWNAACQQQCPVLEIRRIDISPEDVFLQLTGRMGGR